MSSPIFLLFFSSTGLTYCDALISLRGGCIDLSQSFSGSLCCQCRNRLERAVRSAKIAEKAYSLVRKSPSCLFYNVSAWKTSKLSMTRVRSQVGYSVTKASSFKAGLKFMSKSKSKSKRDVGSNCNINVSGPMEIY